MCRDQQAAKLPDACLFVMLSDIVLMKDPAHCVAGRGYCGIHLLDVVCHDILRYSELMLAD